MNNKEIADILRGAANELEGSVSTVEDSNKTDQPSSYSVYTHCHLYANGDFKVQCKAIKRNT